MGDALPVRVLGDEVVPDWLGGADHGWIAALVEVFAGCTGLRVREVKERVRATVSFEAGRKRALAEQVLWSLSSLRPAPSDCRRLREVLFTTPGARVEAVAAASAGIGEATMWDRLFADLPPERVFEGPGDLSAREVAERANLLLVQALVRRSVRVRLVLWGNAHDVVRHVRLQGLICVARRVPDGVELEVSGVFSLFRRTTLYGRAQASIVPRLRWCERFLLEARCRLGDREVVLRHGPRDPVWACSPPRRFDSRVEEWFARDWVREGGWGITRNPEAVDIGGRLVFPDFAVFREQEPEVRWLVEIVGWWTPEYVRSKLEAFRRAGLAGVVLCVDEARSVGASEIPAEVAVVRFAKRVDPLAVRAAIQAMPGGTRKLGTKKERLGRGCYFVDWAGRKGWDDEVHARIARVRPGTEARLEVRGGLLCVVAEGGPVAALSASARRVWEPRLGRVLEVWVREVVERRRELSGAEWRGMLKVERWLLPLVEVTWTPG